MGEVVNVGSQNCYGTKWRGGERGVYFRGGIRSIVHSGARLMLCQSHVNSAGGT